MARSVVVLTLLAAWACAEPSGTSGTPGDPGAAARVGDAKQLCGGAGEACCAAPLPECRIGLACAAASATCEPEAGDAGSTRLCRSAADCAPGQSCCQLGPVGTCSPGSLAECPLPDLRLIAPLSTDPLWQVQDFIDDCRPEAGCQCAIQRGCVPAAGRRRVLLLAPTVLNTGTADLIIGDSALQRVSSTDACSQTPVAMPVLRYELVDGNGNIAATGSGQMTCAPAQPQSAVLPSRFDCEFVGLAPLDELQTFVDCPTDISEVPPGDYDLVVTVNPEHAILEQSYENDSITLPLTMPAWDDPRAPCPLPENPMYGDYRGYERECGWGAPPENQHRCDPGAIVELGCPQCLGDVRLRICDGAEPCNELSRLLTGLTEYGTAVAEGVFTTCPTVQFVCPASGTISSWVGSATPPYAPNAVSCDPTFQIFTTPDLVPVPGFAPPPGFAPVPAPLPAPAPADAGTGNGL